MLSRREKSKDNMLTKQPQCLRYQIKGVENIKSIILHSLLNFINVFKKIIISEFNRKFKCIFSVSFVSSQ